MMEAAMAAKKAKSKKKKAAARGPAVHSVVIFCDGGCTADPDELHVYTGDIVVFIADGTKAKVKFGSKSPFGTGTFNIAKNGFKAAQIDKPKGTFDYTVECTACAVPALPPRIIID
jgi:hypothetical protein